MGVGGFMAAGMVLPMARFAIDPLLKEQDEGKFVNVMPVNEITKEPQMKKFEVKTVDGWNRFKEVKQAFILKLDGKIMAMSPVCTHLGCNVSWEANPAHPNEFYCPCHGGRYEKNGVNIPGTPPTAPLHLYETKVENGDLYLGEAQPRGGA
jgi:menaquinol-cytochrome c reductase iron-sulfur subunit